MNTSDSANSKRIAYMDGEAISWFFRSMNSSGSKSAHYRMAMPSGSLSTGRIIDARGNRPIMILDPTTPVYDDVYLSRSAPATPGTITAPSTIDGGSTWTQIYQGAGLSTTNTVAFGTETVMYRVCAYDSGGLASGWRTSAQVTVVNNHAPTAPASITVPGTVLGGSTLAVAWGAATDQDGDLSGYALERQVDGGTWTEIFTGNALTFTDTITRGWGSVAYRVRAYDSHGAYSGYTTSPARTVNNNVAPVITCATASGTDLGVKSAGFGVDYSASDADGDAVTITETVDGKPWRTFIAGAGQSYTLDLTGEAFMKLLNGDHALKISANDGQVEAVHSLTFSKEVTAASVALAQPMEADAQITICVLSVSGSIPADAAYSVKVTNNALDAAPVWEDCTAAVRAGANHIFANESAANGFAFNFKVEVERGTSGQGGYITSVQGGFQ